MIHELQQSLNFSVSNQTEHQKVTLNVDEEKLELSPREEGTLTAPVEAGNNFFLKFDDNQPLALFIGDDNTLIQDDTISEWNTSQVDSQHVFTRRTESYNQVFTITIHPPITEPPTIGIVVVGTVEINDGKA